MRQDLQAADFTSLTAQITDLESKLSTLRKSLPDLQGAATDGTNGHLRIVAIVEPKNFREVKRGLGSVPERVNTWMGMFGGFLMPY